MWRSQRPPAAHPNGRNDVNRAARLLATGLMASTFWIAAAGTVAAHTALVSSDPVEQSSVPVPPSAITLTFNEDINATFANVVLNDSVGRNWISTTPQIQGHTLTVTVGTDQPTSGVYTVGYRVLSADGHPVSGSYTFTIDAGSTENAPTSPPAGSTAPTSTGATPPSPANEGDTSTTLLSAGIAGLAAGALIALWQDLKRRRNRSSTPQAPHPTSPPAPDTDKPTT